MYYVTRPRSPDITEDVLLNEQVLASLLYLFIPEYKSQ